MSDSIDLSTLRMTCRRCVIDRPRAEGIGVDVPDPGSEWGMGTLVWASFWSRSWLPISSLSVERQIGTYERRVSRSDRAMLSVNTCLKAW